MNIQSWLTRPHMTYGNAGNLYNVGWCGVTLDLNLSNRKVLVLRALKKIPHKCTKMYQISVVFSLPKDPGVGGNISFCIEATCEQKNIISSDHITVFLILTFINLNQKLCYVSMSSCFQCRVEWWLQNILWRSIGLNCDIVVYHYSRIKTP